MFLRSTITALSLVVLAGCSYSPKNTTDYTLCRELSTSSSFNFNTDAREAEVKSRGLDCRVYADRIDEEERALKLEKAGATRINNRTTVQQPIKWEKQTVIEETTFEVDYRKHKTN